MGRQILSFGVAAKHAKITMLADLGDPISVSNYGAFVFDPWALRGITVSAEAFFRKQAEIGDLILRKGGLLLCVLRPPATIQVQNSGIQNPLALLNLAAPHALATVQNSLKMGTVTVWEVLKGAKGITKGFVEALARGLRPDAFLMADVAALGAHSGVPVAVDSVGWPVSVEFNSGPGRVCFVPVPVGVPDGQLGAAIARMVEEHFGGPVEIETPEWADAISVPGANLHDSRIAELKKQAEQIAEELSRLSEERAVRLNFKALLYGYGKSVLEPVVRQALREFDFKVPEECNGDWDVDLTESQTGASAIGEVEGSEGAINVGKLRQLLNYVEAEEDAGRKRKGILVGNGYRLKGLGEPERQNQFTEKVMKEANGFGYCLLPSTELFAAVCAVLKSPGDEALKKHIRDSILATVGAWRFTLPAPSAEPNQQVAG
jgi:hypothetical protein